MLTNIMFKRILKKEIFILISILGSFCIAFGIPVVSYGQIVGGDLGSSSGLFKGKGKPKKNSPASSAPKKTAAKKPAPAKTKNTTPNNTAAAKPAKSTGGGTLTVARNTNRNISRSTTGSTDPNAEELFERALEERNPARDTRNYIGAEKSYRRAQSRRPRDSRAVYGLGNLYSDQPRWEEAEKPYREAIALDPDVPETYIALSFVLTQPIGGSDG